MTEPRTQKEIDDLKAQWKSDPCWDLFSTEGFEYHKDELYTYQERMEMQWADEYRKRITDKAAAMNCTFETAEHIERLELRILHLECMT